MAANKPIDPVVRLAIANWPGDAPRGAVSTFCLEHGISRKSFYELRKRARDDGQAAVLEPRSRRPRSSPTTLTDEVKAQAVAVPDAPDSSGSNHGAIKSTDSWMSTRMFRPAAAGGPGSSNSRANTAKRNIAQSGVGLVQVSMGVDDCAERTPWMRPRTRRTSPVLN